MDKYIANVSNKNTDAMKQMMKDNGADVKDGDEVRTITQLFTETAEVGKVYAAASSAYYGTQKGGLTLYETRKVYGVMREDKTWYFFVYPICDVFNYSSYP